jgi:hypothetical protein
MLKLRDHVQRSLGFAKSAALQFALRTIKEAPRDTCPEYSGSSLLCAGNRMVCSSNQFTKPDLRLWLA